MIIRCECLAGYTGGNCTIKVNHCESLPCWNNGKCFSGVYNYTCTCPVPFTGRNCETGKYSLDEQSSTSFSRYKFYLLMRIWSPFLFTVFSKTPYLFIELSSDYVVHFTKSGTTDYVDMKGPATNLLEVVINARIKHRNRDRMLIDAIIILLNPISKLSLLHQNISFQLTTCLWLQSTDTFNYGTVLSYATRYYDNAFTLTDYNG